MQRIKILVLASALAFVPTWDATSCHLPEHLRDQEPNLTVAQLSLLAHGGSKMEQIAYSLRAPANCVGGMADIFPCENVDLLAHLPLSDIGGGSGNDMWGWVDPMTGKEWAIVGRSNGTAFIDVSDPTNPVYFGNLPTAASTSSWRDIKVYQDHAYVVADFAGAHGMQVFDLTKLRDVTSPPETFTEDSHYSGFGRSHNVVINEDTGFAYAVGSDTCSGGLHMIDITNPLTPTFAGCFSADGYTHDAQCVIYHGLDADYVGSEICFASNEDTLTVVDVTDKTNPTQLARVGYTGSGYTHQGWLTEDHASFVHDDELDERNFGHTTKTYVWDLTDLDAPSIRATFFAAGTSIDHNQYVKGDHTYQANYKRGLRILSVENAPTSGELAEVGFFDTYPDGDGNQFSGAWSTYPFFPSGIVLVSDINRGLFVLQARVGGENLFGDGFESGDSSRWSVQGPPASP